MPALLEPALAFQKRKHVETRKSQVHDQKIVVEGMSGPGEVVQSPHKGYPVVPFLEDIRDVTGEFVGIDDQEDTHLYVLHILNVSHTELGAAEDLIVSARQVESRAILLTVSSQNK